MISARHLASNHLCVPQLCKRRPYCILIICSIGLFILLLHYSSRDTSTYNRTVRQTHRGSSVIGQNSKQPPQQNYPSRLTRDNLCSNLEPQLLLRIEDLRKIKLSVSNELIELEQDKAKLLAEKDNLNTRNEKLLLQIGRSKTQLRQLEIDISASRRRKFDKTCDDERLTPVIFKPLDFHQFQEYSLGYESKQAPVEYSTVEESKPYSFNLSSCSLTKDFKFYLNSANQELNTTDVASNKPTRIDTHLVEELLQNHPQHTDKQEDACLTISILADNQRLPNLRRERNNLVINMVVDNSALQINNQIHNQAAIASTQFLDKTFRDNFDIVLPSIWQHPDNHQYILESIPPQSPIERKYLASYFGRNLTSHATISEDYRSQTDQLEDILRTIHRNSFNDLFLFIYQCEKETSSNCYEERAKMVELSVFLIILAHGPTTDDYFNDLIYLALSRGTIPVIICDDKRKLPFAEVLDWQKASIILPVARLPEVHFIVRTYAAADIYQLKYNVRLIFERYLATAKQILDTTIGIMSIERFNYPPPPGEDIETPTYFSPEELMLDVNCTSSVCEEAKNEMLNSVVSSEILGPREKSLASATFRRNFSLVFNSKYELWNNPFHSPFKLYPNNPKDPIPPAEYKFYATDQGYRPIADGVGGSGSEFSRSLGGDYPNEQFTLVLLTYERKNLMLKTLERLKGIPYLNKVLIVWNGIQHKPQPDIVWPDMQVPIVVVRVERNSLNNRFLPFDAIETEAILSIDDDSPLRPDEIVFAFRVWRQSRDRIVGFPGRFHAWDNGLNSWVYNSNHSCELSMVLTGGAFFHKFYAYQYTYNMPPVIRSIVDKFMNCEDIAMNFLVSHLTRKPPIKVTSRWTFHCSGCTASLSEDESHFRERHECLNTFTSIYGYMPLMMTQSRSDSVLFKTRLPANEQKCFKYV